MSQVQRLSPRDWIHSALDAMVLGGIQAVRIDALARRLGVTKGSFYHHFESREALLDAIAEDWSEQELGDLIEEVGSLPGDARMRYKLVFAVYQRRGLAKYDRAIRAWAQFDERAAKAVERATEEIERLFARLFREMGFDEAQSFLRGRLSLVLAIGAVFVTGLPRDDDPPDTADRILDLLTGETLHDGQFEAKAALGLAT